MCTMGLNFFKSEKVGFHEVWTRGNRDCAVHFGSVLIHGGCPCWFCLLALPGQSFHTPISCARYCASKRPLPTFSNATTKYFQASWSTRFANVGPNITSPPMTTWCQEFVDLEDSSFTFDSSSSILSFALTTYMRKTDTILSPGLHPVKSLFKQFWAILSL